MYQLDTKEVLTVLYWYCDHRVSRCSGRLGWARAVTLLGRQAGLGRYSQVCVGVARLVASGWPAGVTALIYVTYPNLSLAMVT